MLLQTDTSNILAMITNAGFKIVSLKLTQLTVADAQAFLRSTCCKTFYGELVEFMSRGPIVAAILERQLKISEL
jgi:nucleoside-diphosphate kinase